MPRFEAHPERRPAIVTGASSGIGRATAIALGTLGYPVILGARRIDRLEEVAASIRTAGGEATAIALDLIDPESVKSFVSDAIEAFGSIEIVVSNAGDVQPLTTVEANPEDYARQLGVNLLGPQRLMHLLVPGMLQRQRGDVVFVTSEVALSPRPHMSAYVASKSGLEAMAHAMRMEMEGSGVRVGIVRPGPAATEQGSSWAATDIDRALASWQHWGLMRHDGYLRPSDVAAAVTAMVSVPRGTHFTVLEVQPEAPTTTPTEEPS